MYHDKMFNMCQYQLISLVIIKRKRMLNIAILFISLSCCTCPYKLCCSSMLSRTNFIPQSFVHSHIGCQLGPGFVPYLNDGRMLKESRVTHKSHIVYLQFKLLPTHIRFGGQDGGKNDVRKP